MQQLRETFPYEAAAKFLLLHHDSKYGTEVPVAIRALGITAVRTVVGCPWQNGVAERWVGSCRRELLVDFRSRHRKSDRVAQLEAPCLRGLVSEVFIIVTNALPDWLSRRVLALANHLCEIAAAKQRYLRIIVLTLDPGARNR